LVDGPEGQHGSDAGQIEAFIEEPADLSETDEVVVAVAAGTPLATGWIDQAPGLVEPEVLGSAAHQFSCYGNSVQALGRIRTVPVPHRSTVRKFAETPCFGHGRQDITNMYYRP
jgi:hypothetical protein